MTEQELRASLKAHLAPADLPDRRKQALLANLRQEAAPEIEKGDAPMFRPSKFRAVLIAALIVTLLSATIALAAGFSGYVNFKGESVEAGKPVPTPLPAEDDPAANYDLAQRMQSIINSSPKDQTTIVYHQAITSNSSSWLEGTADVDSLEELVALLPPDIPLPKIPEGYTFSNGNVHFYCAADGAYELVRDETRDDGIIVKGYKIPEDKRVTGIANYTLKAEDRRSVTVSITLGRNNRHFFNVDNAESVITPEIPGMDEAILIVRPASARLVMQRKLTQPVSVVDPITLNGKPDAQDMSLTHMTIYLYTTTVPADVLLSMYE